ncbi:MAG: ABC transporter substrate-binding protein [Deltaproteobacteria bacterium]|nr:ABC transporter substrate-binding protein [Deltaproteobacteria bacterium]
MLRKGVLAVWLVLGFLSLCLPGFAQETTKLRVSAATKTLGYGPLWVASKMGFFARQGLDVELVVIRGSDVNVQALAGGSIEVSGGAADAPIAAVERGLDLVIIGGVINGLTQSLMGGKSYKTYEDLRGATIGIISLTSGVGFALRWVLKNKGLEYPRDYRLLVVGGTPQTFVALASGQIAAGPLSLPLNYAAEEAGFNEIGRFIDVIPNYQLASLTVKRSWAEKNRAVLVRVMRAMAQTAQWLYQNKEAAVDFLASEMKLKREHARRGWEFYTEKRVWHPNADVNIEGLKNTIQIFWEVTQSKPPPPSPSKYVDQSYLEEALRGLR